MTDNRPPPTIAFLDTEAQEALFEDLANRVAQARTTALMGDRDESRQLLAAARADYLRYWDVLAGVAGVLALEHSLETAERVVRAI